MTETELMYLEQSANQGMPIPAVDALKLIAEIRLLGVVRVRVHNATNDVIELLRTMQHIRALDPNNYERASE